MNGRTTNRLPPAMPLGVQDGGRAGHPDWLRVCATADWCYPPQPMRGATAVMRDSRSSHLQSSAVRRISGFVLDPLFLSVPTPLPKRCPAGQALEVASQANAGQSQGITRPSRSQSSSWPEVTDSLTRRTLQTHSMNGLREVLSQAARKSPRLRCTACRHC